MENIVSRKDKHPKYNNNYNPFSNGVGGIPPPSSRILEFLKILFISILQKLVTFPKYVLT